jgi:hypothetical protein
VVEIIGTLEDRYRDQHLAVGRRRQQKKWTLGDGGSRQMSAAARVRMNHRAAPAPRKRRNHRGPTEVEKRWKSPECNNNLRNRNLKQQLYPRSKEKCYDSLGKSIGLETVKRTVGAS